MEMRQALGCSSASSSQCSTKCLFGYMGSKGLLTAVLLRRAAVLSKHTQPTIHKFQELRKQQGQAKVEFKREVGGNRVFFSQRGNQERGEQLKCK